MLRFVAMLLALTMAGAPVLLGVCRSTCADLSHPQSAEAGPRHSCHDGERPASGARLTAAHHFCGHVDVLPTGTGEPFPASSQDVALLVLAGPIQPFSDVIWYSLFASPERRPVSGTPATVPLRI